MTNFQKVKTFMQTFGQEVKSKPSFSSEKINDLRYNLIKEELGELKQAMDDKDLLEVADALTDILYVTYGAGLELNSMVIDISYLSSTSKIRNPLENTLRFSLSFSIDGSSRTLLMEDKAIDQTQ